MSARFLKIHDGGVTNLIVCEEIVVDEESAMEVVAHYEMENEPFPLGQSIAYRHTSGEIRLFTFEKGG